MDPPDETSSVQEGVGLRQGRVGETDHGTNPRQPPTQDTATQVIGVNQAGTLAPSQEEAEEKMAQVFKETQASSIDLEEQCSEDDDDRENADENLNDEDNDGEEFDDLESESESSVIYIGDAFERH